MLSADEQRALAQANLQEFVQVHDRVPAAKEWDALHVSPSRPTIRRLFGDWTTFMRSVGYEPLCEGKPTADVDLDAVIDHLRAGKTLQSIAEQIGRRPQVLRIRVDRYLRLTGQPPLDLPRGGRHPQRRRAGEL